MPLFCVGGAATQPSEVCEDLSPKPLAAHHVLLTTAISQQLGPLAAAVCRALTRGGTMALTDISEAVRNDEEMRAVAAAAATRATATGAKTTAVPATHHVGTNLRVEPAELASASDLIHEVAVKEVMTRLVVHRVVFADPTTQLYGLRSGSGVLLRVLFPLLLHCVRQQYGEAAKCALLAVYQLGVVPPSAAVQVALSRTPSIGRDTLEYAVAQLAQDGWLIPASGADATPLDSSGGGSSQQTLWDGTTPYCIGLESALFFLTNDAVEQAVAERFADGGLALTLIRALRRRLAPNSPFADPAASWQQLAAELPATAAAAGVRRDRSGRPVSHGDAASATEAVQRCLQRLCQPVVLLSCEASQSMTSTAPLAVSAAAGSSAVLSASGAPALLPLPATRALVVQSPQQSGFYRVDSVTAVHLLQEAVCERVVFAGYGVLGVRIMKLLLQHRHLEERTLAEQSVATYTKTRDTLHHMFKDGILTQQEVPRSGAMAERTAKNSIFLWGISWTATLLPAVRERLAKSLTIALVRLREAQEQAAALASEATKGRLPEAAQGSSGISGASSTRQLAEEAEAQWKSGMTRVMQQTLQVQRTVTGLQSCVMALLRLLFIVDYL